jgi:transposase
MGRNRRPYPKEFREDAVRLARESDKTVSEVARDLGLDPGTLFIWIRRSKAPSPLDEGERAELVRLRRRVRTLETEREILKKAAAFFAREDDPTT